MWTPVYSEPTSYFLQLFIDGNKYKYKWQSWIQCMRTECDYNPEHDFYYETIGYLEDEPYGIHIYYNVRI